MAKTWTDIASTAIDAESPVTEDLLGDFYDRDESLISTPIDTRFAEASVSSGVYGNLATVKVYIPPAAATTGGTVTLEVVFEAKVSTGNGDVQAKLGSGGTFSSSVNVTATAYGASAFVTLSIPAADVAAAADSTIDLIIEGRNNSGGSITARCESSASRLERAA